MPREIKMPKLSDTMEEGTINVWRKTEGERIQKGDVLVEIETDKADMEFEAYMSGSLAKILVPAGETVSVGVPIAVVRLERDSDDDLAKFLKIFILVRRNKECAWCLFLQCVEFFLVE